MKRQNEKKNIKPPQIYMIKKLFIYQYILYWWIEIIGILLLQSSHSDGGFMPRSLMDDTQAEKTSDSSKCIVNNCKKQRACLT